MNHKPVKITVATVTYNAVGVLQRTLDSVAAQNYAHVEHLIIDGNSHDGTLALFQHYQENNSRAGVIHEVNAISEPDKGIYDAGVLTHDTTFPIMRMWMKGFLDTFAEAGHPVPEENIVLCDTSSSSAIDATKKLYAEKRLPKAMFCESDVLAHGMLFACHELGVSIPGDVEVFTIGINMAEFNDYAIPSLSRIDIPMREIGEKCLHLLVDLIEKKTPKPTVVYAEGIKIIGQSSPEA